MNVVLCISTDINAITQFDGFFANSFASFGGKMLFANSEGVFMYDETSEEEVVDAFFELPRWNFGYIGIKAIRSILLDGKFDGDLVVDVDSDPLGTVSYPVQMTEGESGAKVAANSRHRGRYFGIKVSNVDGSYFSIDNMDAVFIKCPERRT